MLTKQRLAVGLLSISAVGLSAWVTSEGTGPMAVRDGVAVHKPYIPTAGDVPTIGHGSTRYEDGQPVRLTDPPITRQRAMQLAKNLMSKDEVSFRASIPGVKLHTEEYDLYINWVGQFGLGNWSKPKSPRTWLLKGGYVQACESLLIWRFQAGRDCKLPKNWGPRGCKGVWTRQQQRYASCMAVQ